MPAAPPACCAVLFAHTSTMNEDALGVMSNWSTASMRRELAGIIGIGSKTDFLGNILDQSVVVKLGVI
jgi:hypothetical protein